MLGDGPCRVRSGRGSVPPRHCVQTLFNRLSSTVMTAASPLVGDGTDNVGLFDGTSISICSLASENLESGTGASEYPGAHSGSKHVSPRAIPIKWVEFGAREPLCGPHRRGAAEGLSFEVLRHEHAGFRQSAGGDRSCSSTTRTTLSTAEKSSASWRRSD
jgi:hypothetical protein